MRTTPPDPRRGLARYTSVAIALLLILLPALAVAGPHGRRGPGPGHDGCGHGPGMGPGGMGPGFLLGRMADRLELSEAQRDEIRGILEARREAGAGAREEIHAARQALFTLIHAEETDEAAIRQAVADLSALEADRAVERSLALQEVRRVLTPEQRAEAQQHFEEMKELADERRGRFHRRGPRYGE